MQNLLIIATLSGLPFLGLSAAHAAHPLTDAQMDEVTAGRGMSSATAVGTADASGSNAMVNINVFIQTSPGVSIASESSSSRSH